MTVKRQLGKQGRERKGRGMWRDNRCWCRGRRRTKKGRQRISNSKVKRMLGKQGKGRKGRGTEEEQQVLVQRKGT